MIPARSAILPALLAGALLACSKPETVPAKRTAELAVEGMSCTGCESTIGTAVREVAGVESCTASFATSKVAVTYDPARTDEAHIAAAIRAAGYTVPEKR